MMDKPWNDEFPNDDAEEMDEEAIRILFENMRAGRKEND